MRFAPHSSLWATRLVLLAAICAAAVAQSGGPVLLFHDGSPSAERHVGAWSAAHGERHTVISVNSLDGFITHLFTGRWSRVIILAQFSAPHDILASVLQDYAAENPSGLDIRMLLFSNGSSVPGLVICNWSFGSTSTAYAWLDNVDPAAGNAVTTPGYAYPQLNGLRFRSMSSVTSSLHLQVNGPSPRERGISEDPCQQCQIDYDNALVICDTDRTERMGVGDALYGPGAQPPHTQNPTQYTACVSNANNSHTNCVKDASQDFDLCELYHSCNAGGGKK